MDILYKGNSPPNAFASLVDPVETNVSPSILLAYFVAGHAANANYSIIVRDDGAVKYWYPPANVEPVKVWDAYDFKLRLTYLERIAIRTAAKTDALVEDFLDMLDTAAATNTRILSNDTMVLSGLGYMESVGVLAEGRAEEIVA